ncbi:MAG: hypothetical protein JJE29_02045 [Peptostreptococcaceae bacterium]|nr:hypothetical protein [Peptostreptococcaceae bacterium]
MNVEQRKARRKKKRRVRWMRLLLFAVAVSAGAWYFISGGTLPDIPFLKSFEPVRIYAIDISENSTEIAIEGEGLVVYDNGALTFYDLEGTSIWKKTIEAKNPRLFANETYIVLADTEQGKLWRLNYEGGIVNSLEKEFPLGGLYQNRENFLLYFGQEGNLLDVIDDKGKTITEITIPKGYILDAAISDSSNIIAVSTLSIDNEKYYSSILFYNLDGIVMAGNRYDGEIIFRTFFSRSDNLKALAGNRVFSMSREGDVLWEEDLEGKLARVDLDDSGYVSMIVEDTNGDTIYFGIGDDGIFSKKTALDEISTGVSFNGKYGAAFMKRSVAIFDDNGRLKGKIESDFEIEGGGWLAEDRIMLVYENRMEIIDIY